MLSFIAEHQTKAMSTNFTVFGLTQQENQPVLITHEMSTLTIWQTELCATNVQDYFFRTWHRQETNQAYMHSNYPRDRVWTCSNCILYVIKG